MLCCKRVRISPAKTMETQGGVPRIWEFVDFSNSAIWSVLEKNNISENFRIGEGRPPKTMETQGGVPRRWELM